MLNIPVENIPGRDDLDEHSRSNDETFAAETPKRKPKTLLLIYWEIHSLNTQCSCTIDALEDLIHSEILRYKTEATISVDGDPLVWWSTFFPSLSQLTQKYLCVVATSVPSEQVFSTAENVVSCKRSSLFA